jgi:hypothetical protein
LRHENTGRYFEAACTNQLPTGDQQAFGGT